MVEIGKNELTYYKCLWKTTSENPKSTTFMHADKNEHLYKCKYLCCGYGFYRDNYKWVECEFYKPLIKYKKAIKRIKMETNRVL